MVIIIIITTVIVITIQINIVSVTTKRTILIFNVDRNVKSSDENMDMKLTSRYMTQVCLFNLIRDTPLDRYTLK